jgi:hypothetical protein
MAIILDHTSSGNIFLKGFPENLNPYPNLNIENGGILGYLNGFPIEYIGAYNNGYSYTWGNIVSAGNSYWIRVGEPNPGYPPYQGSPYWQIYQYAQESTFILDATQDVELLTSGTSINSISNLQHQLDLKENLINLGNVHDQNTGILAGNIVVVEQFQDNSITINPSLISNYAIKDTFTINNTGQLITLSNSDIGDVAIDIINNNNYILCSSGIEAYLNINNWIPFTGLGEGVLYVNGHAPDGLGNVDIDSNEIYYCKQNLITISDKISETNVTTTGILQNYQKCNLFLNETGKYALTSTFENIASGKICENHNHEISGVVNLSGRLEILKFLNTGNLVDSQRSYSYFLGDQNFTYSCNSLILGQYGLSCYNSEIVYTPSHLNTVDTGNFQSSIILGSGCTNSDDCISLKQINMNQYNYHFVVANIVGRSDDCQICAAYDLYGALARQDGSIFKIQNTACEVKGEELNIDFNSISTNLYSLDLTGYLNKSMKWFSKINVISIQDTGYNLFIGTE